MKDDGIWWSGPWGLTHHSHGLASAAGTTHPLLSWRENSSDPIMITILCTNWGDGRVGLWEMIIPHSAIQQIVRPDRLGATNWEFAW